MKEKKTNSVKDISLMLNNALAFCRVPASGAIPEKRMRALSGYALALIAPLKDDMKDELLRPEEAVFVLVSAALMTQALHVQKTDKLPMLVEAQKVLDEDAA